MRAVVIRQHGGRETLAVTDEPVPEPGPDEVTIRVRGCALNHLDTWVRRGVPGHAYPLPLVPGSDVSGIVHRSNSPRFAPGAEVVAAPFVSCRKCEACLQGNDVACRSYSILGEGRDGGCAEYVCVPATHVFPKPPNLTFAEAASLLLAPLTAWHMLHHRARVAAGETVLVTAAAGGVGTAAIQIAVRAGARVIATVGSDLKRDAVLSLGADEAILLRSEDDPATVLKEVLGRPAFDVVIDSVGGTTFEAGVRYLRRFGRLVTCGATANHVPSVDLRRVFFLSLSLLGSTMGSLPELRQVLDLAATGQLRPVLHAVLPLDQIAEAHRILESREVIGKVVVEP